MLAMKERDTETIDYDTMQQLKALRRAIRIAGSTRALAKQIGTSRQAVDYWLVARRRPVPSRYVLAIEAATGVSRYDLRPDIYPYPAP